MFDDPKSEKNESWPLEEGRLGNKQCWTEKSFLANPLWLNGAPCLTQLDCTCDVPPPEHGAEFGNLPSNYP